MFQINNYSNHRAQRSHAHQMQSLIWVLFTLVLFASIEQSAFAQPVLLRPPLSTYYVDKPGGIDVINPKNPQQIIGRLENGSPITNSFLLNSDGDPFEVEVTEKRGEFSKEKQKSDKSNTLPYFDKNQRPYLGFRINGRVGAIPADHLSKVGIRTSTPDPIEDPKDPPDDKCCQVEPVTQLTNTSPYENLDQATLDASHNLLTEFHNTMCGTRRPTGRSNMEQEINGLYNEWSRFEFTKLQGLKGVDRELMIRHLGIAKNLDLVTRTILYEADIMGLREGVVAGRTSADNKTAYETCTSPERCDVSTCERDMMTLSIRNRGYARRECADPKRRRELEAVNPAACKYFGDFAYRATNPTQYNIWDPRWTNRFIASCFMKNGLEDSDLNHLPADLRWPFRRAIRQYQLTLESAKRILYKSEDSINSYFQLDDNIPVKGNDPLSPMKHYIHPFGMTLCKFGEYDQRVSIRAAYAQKILPDSSPFYTLLIDEVLVAVSTPQEHPDERTKSPLYRKVYLRDSNTWLVQNNEIKNLPPANSNNECLKMGLAFLRDKNINACSIQKIRNMPHFSESWLLQSRFVPKWALPNYVKQPFIGCQLETATRRAEIGDQCDPRFQPYLNVDGTPMTPMNFDRAHVRRFGLNPNQVMMNGFVVSIDRNSADEVELTVQRKKNIKIISALTLLKDATTYEIDNFKPLEKYPSILWIETKAMTTTPHYSRTCYDVHLVNISVKGHASILSSATYRCDVESDSARIQASSFVKKYRIQDQKNRPDLVFE